MASERRAAGGMPPGTRMGRYELLHRLAMGGMAELYVARHSGIQGFERIVVLKRVLPHLTEDPEFIRMFLDEARIAASLDHPSIAQVTDIDEEQGEYFFAMEYVHGKNLREVLKHTPQGLSLGMALTIMTSLAAGLHHAHEALGPDGRPLGLVHRDVSPSNVMIAHSGAVKLTDFGIAKASARTSKTLAGRIKGKVGYMSPEQCRAEDIDRRSDIFALGILLYELTTGARAFYAPNDFAAMARIASADYVPPSELEPGYPKELERIIARALRKDPTERYATAEAMQLELVAFAEAAGIRLSAIDLASHMRDVFGNPAHPQTTTGDRVPATAAATVVIAPRRRGRTVWLAAPLVAVLGAGAAALFLPPNERDASRATDGADPEREQLHEGASLADVAPAPASAPVRAPDPEPQPAHESDADSGSVPGSETGDEPPTTSLQAAPERTAKPKRRRPKSGKSRSSSRPSPPSPYPPGYER